MHPPAPVTLHRLFSERGWSLATAESCTGGLLGNLITDRPGSSDFFRGGVIAYSNRSKIRLLGVNEKTLAGKGAVSPETARAMARGVKKLFRSSVGAAITGIAGPGGGSPGKPVGLVYIALARPEGETVAGFIFSGSRPEIKLQAAERALDLLVVAAGGSAGLPVPGNEKTG
jgi:PncC family amidohydrolase